MKKFNKIISMLLAVFMLISAFSVMFTVQVFADDSEETTTGTTDSGNTEETTTGTSAEGGDAVVIPESTDYVNQLYANPDEKIATMRLAIERNGYQLYVDDVSGEVAFVNTITGDKLFTNPYDVGASTGSDSTKYEILSQIIVEFTDTTGQTKTFTSYEQAVLREQLAVEYIKNGIRVEYTIGREQAKTLVPRLMSYERYKEMILTPLYEEFGDELYNYNTTREDVTKVQGFLSKYVIYSKESMKDTYGMTGDEYDNLNELTAIHDDLYSSYPQTYLTVKEDFKVIDSMDIVVFKPDASEAEIAKVEEIVLMYCPDYTYEELEYDHSITDYVSQDENPPVFRMALEYTIGEDGLSVRLPANGVRFNESLYTLESIKILPYMGAGNNAYSGYNFYPDGSGALFEYDDMDYSVTHTVTGQVYGTDYSYHKISGAYQETISYPVFGIVEKTEYHHFYVTDADTGEISAEATLAGILVDGVRAHEKGETTVATKGKEAAIAKEYLGIVNYPDAIEETYQKKHGFLAIIEQGDALTSLTTYHAGPLSAYNTVMMSVTPRPKDSYNLQDSISVGSDSEWTVVSERKYTGSYAIKYVLLSDTESLDKDVAEDTYDASWFGMAVAYRDYLTKIGVISKLTDDEVLDSIPLYIETFGAVETTEKILSIPVEVMTALTSFEDIETMYDELSKQGIKNVNFKLTGYTKDGMFYVVPTKVKFEKAVGGKKGFQELLDYANDVNSKDENSNMGIYPDFDIAYQIADDLFNGYSKFNHAAKTIDDRYASRREYSATQQKYVNYYDLIISPAYFDVIYNQITKNYANKYQNVQGISVSTLGSALNSDFDEDEPYNREDSKAFAVEAFAHLDKTYGQVMTNKANAYVWQYVDHMLGMALDSSNYSFASHSVPFLGVVLHGSVSFTGEALNMEGDLQYAILKAIENGASPYFILSYQNTQTLKEYSYLSKYYSVRYDIWKDDIVNVYNTLNDVLADVQNKYITNHEFLTGIRVPDADELEADLLAEYLEALMTQENIVSILQKEATLIASEAREAGREAEAYAAEAIVAALANYTSIQGSIDSAVSLDITDSYFEDIKKAYVDYYKMVEVSGSESDEAKYMDYIVDAIVDFHRSYDEISDINEAVQNAVAGYQAALADETFVADFTDAYKEYLEAAIALVLAQYMTDDEADALTIDLVAYICDGHLKEDKDTFTSTIKTYFATNLDVVVKICAGMLTENDMKSVIQKALKENYNEEEVNALSTDDLKALFIQSVTQKEHLGSAFDMCANDIVNSIFGDIAQNVFDTFGRVVISSAHSSLKDALGKYNKDYSAYVNSLDAYNKALDAYNNALEADGAEADSTKKAKEDLDAAEAGLNTAEVDLKDKKADVEYAMAKIELATTHLSDSAEVYLAASSASAALTKVAISGFNIDFAEYMAIYDVYNETYEYYSVYQKLAKADHANTTYADATGEYAECAKAWFEKIGTWFEEYAENATAKDKADAEIDAILDGCVKSHVDNYIDALAQLGAIEELGYKDNAPEWIKDIYNAVSAQVPSIRANAIKALEKVQGSAVRTLKELFETAEEHFAASMEAIDLLAEIENVTVEYSEGGESNPYAITNYDEIDSLIVLQAIDRARAVYDYLYVNSYEKIS